MVKEVWKTLSKTMLLERKPWFDVFVEKVELPNGKIIKDYHEICMPHFTAVFAVTTEKKIMVMRCYRHAVKEVTLTMPGGQLENGEEPLEGIKREFLEETGYKASYWHSLGDAIGSSTKGCGTYHFFYASGAYPTQEPNSGDLEELELILWSSDEVERAIDSGQAKSLGVISILFLGLRHMKSLSQLKSS